MEHVNPIWAKLLDVLGMNVRYTHASGGTLFTSDGRTILDCLSGYCVHNTGHNHPYIVGQLIAELQAQSPAMLQSNVVESAGALAQTLCAYADGKVSKAFFCSSGSEGIEAVIKFARAHTGRRYIWREGFGPMLEGTHQVPFGDLKVLEETLRTRKLRLSSSSPSRRKAGSFCRLQTISLALKSCVRSTVRSSFWTKYRPAWDARELSLQAAAMACNRT